MSEEALARRVRDLETTEVVVNAAGAETAEVEVLKLVEPEDPPPDLTGWDGSWGHKRLDCEGPRSKPSTWPELRGGR